MESFDRGDALHEEAKGSWEVGNLDNGGDDATNGIEGLNTQATTPLYPGSKTSVVSTMIIIMNICTKFHV